MREAEACASRPPPPPRPVPARGWARCRRNGLQNGFAGGTGAPLVNLGEAEAWRGRGMARHGEAARRARRDRARAQAPPSSEGMGTCIMRRRAPRLHRRGCAEGTQSRVQARSRVRSRARSRVRSRVRSRHEAGYRHSEQGTGTNGTALRRAHGPVAPLAWRPDGARCTAAPRPGPRAAVRSKPYCTTNGNAIRSSKIRHTPTKITKSSRQSRIQYTPRAVAAWVRTTSLNISNYSSTQYKTVA